MSEDKTKSPARAAYDAYCASTPSQPPYDERTWDAVAKAVASLLPTPRPSPTGEPPPPPSP